MNANEQLNKASKSAGLLDDAIRDGTFDLDFVKNLVTKTEFDEKIISMNIIVK